MNNILIIFFIVSLCIFTLIDKIIGVAHAKEAQKEQDRQSAQEFISLLNKLAVERKGYRGADIIVVRSEKLAVEAERQGYGRIIGIVGDDGKLTERQS